MTVAFGVVCMAKRLKDGHGLLSLTIFWTILHGSLQIFSQSYYQERVSLYISELDWVFPVASTASVSLDGFLLICFFLIVTNLRCYEGSWGDVYRWQGIIFSTGLVSAILSALWASVYFTLVPVKVLCGRGYEEFRCRPVLSHNQLAVVSCKMDGFDAAKLEKLKASQFRNITE